MNITIPSKLIQLTGNMYLSRYPMWMQYKPHHYHVHGDKIQKIIHLLKPGDILLRRYNGYLNTVLTPGFWGHAALYLGDGELVHSISVGVTKETILQFCRCDAFVALRFKNPSTSIDSTLKRANEIIGKPYDFEFVWRDDKFCCTEVINTCYPNNFDKYFKEVIRGFSIFPFKILRSQALLPDAIYNHPELIKIVESKNKKMQIFKE